jgi:hypothetical protein
MRLRSNKTVQPAVRAASQARQPAPRLTVETLGGRASARLGVEDAVAD